MLVPLLFPNILDHNSTYVLNAFTLFIVLLMWALVHFREQTERLRVKRIRADKKAAKTEKNKKRNLQYAANKEGEHSQHYFNNIY